VPPGCQRASLCNRGIVVYERLVNGMSLISQKPNTVSGRSLEVTRTYLQTGQAVGRSLWVRVSPRHPLLKAAIALPLGALVLVMLVLILIVLGFTILAVAIMATTSRAGEKDGGEA
jgi:hypothetical protein